MAYVHADERRDGLAGLHAEDAPRERVRVRLELGHPVHVLADGLPRAGRVGRRAQLEGDMRGHGRIERGERAEREREGRRRP